MGRDTPVPEASRDGPAEKFISRILCRVRLSFLVQYCTKSQRWLFGLILDIADICIRHVEFLSHVAENFVKQANTFSHFFPISAPENAPDLCVSLANIAAALPTF